MSGKIQAIAAGMTVNEERKVNVSSRPLHGRTTSRPDPQDQRKVSMRTVIASAFSTLKDNFYNDFIVDNRWKWLLDGLGVTSRYLDGFLGIILGLIVALIKVSQFHGKNPCVQSTGRRIRTRYPRNADRCSASDHLLRYLRQCGHRQSVGGRSGVRLIAAPMSPKSSVPVSSPLTEVRWRQRSLGLGYGMTMRKIILPQAIKYAACLIQRADHLAQGNSGGGYSRSPISPGG